MSGNKRQDLQGIRGIAIISVLLFHFFPDYFPNGYVGVDQFFVLSGFLISLVLSREKEISTSVIIEFYYRRIKRIFPLYLLFILLALVSLYLVFPIVNLESNLDSAWPALFFYTNIRSESNEDKEYYIMLQVAQDVFTHTWSLAVEIQFYCFVPFIFALFFITGQRVNLLIILIIGVSSCAYHIMADQSVAFNSVFARMWQFGLGLFAQQLSQKKKIQEPAKVEEKANLLEDSEDEFDIEKNEKTEKIISIQPEVAEQVKEDEESGKVVHAMSIILLIVLLVATLHPVAILPFYLRVVTSLVTACLILCGHLSAATTFLNQWFLVHMGDISYAVYLIHWPIVAYCKMEHPEGAIIGLAVALILSELETISFEKWYLTLSKKPILALVFILFAINSLIISFPVDIDDTPDFQDGSDFSGLNGNVSWQRYMPKPNMTTDEIVAYNSWLDGSDFVKYGITGVDTCVYRVKRPYGWCDFEDVGINGKLKVLAIGNSYTGTTAELIYRHCKNKIGKMSFVQFSAREPLVCNDIKHKEFLDTVIEFKPDILFLVQRHLNMMHPSGNGTDQYLELALKRIKDYIPLVKKDIYITDAFPQPRPLLGKELGQMLRDNVTLTEDDQAQFEQGNYMIARDRLQKIVKSCAKCHLIDYMPPLMYKNRTFQFFDMDKHYTHFTRGQHFTAVALDKLEPLFEDFCHNNM